MSLYFILSKVIINELGESYNWIYDQEQNNYVGIGYIWPFSSTDVVNYLSNIDCDVTLFTDWIDSENVTGYSLCTKTGLFTHNTCCGNADASEEFMIMNTLIQYASWDSCNSDASWTSRYQLIN